MRFITPLVLTLTMATAVAAQTPTELIDHAMADLAAAKAQLAPVPPADFRILPPDSSVQVVLGDGGGVLTAGAMGAVLHTAGQPAVIVTGCGWTITGFEIVGDANDLIVQTATGCDLVIDHMNIHGDPITGAKRGIALNGAHARVTNSRIWDIKRAGQDSQAIGGWDGPGPYWIENNYLEAAGENIMFGGADPSTSGLIPSDITIRGNEIAKPASWRGQTWTVKNLIELKNARRVTITGNRMHGSWTGAQGGFALMLTPRNQDGACPWCGVTDVVFEGNTVSDVGAAVNLLGSDDINLSQPLQRVSIRNNTIEVCTTTYPGAARIFQVSHGPVDLAITGNTVTSCAGSWLALMLTIEDTITRLVVRDNLLPEGAYGVHSPDAALGTATLDLHAPGYVWSNNRVTRTVPENNIPYPAGTIIE